MYSATAILNSKWKARQSHDPRKHLLINDSPLNKWLHAQLRNQRSYHGGLKRELGSGMAFWWQETSGSNTDESRPRPETGAWQTWTHLSHSGQSKKISRNITFIRGKIHCQPCHWQRRPQDYR